MIAKMSLCLLLLMGAHTNLQAGMWDRFKSVFIANETEAPPTVKVLIAHDVPFAEVEVKGAYNLYDPYRNKRIATRFSARNNRVQALPVGIKWGEEFPGVYQFEIIPDSHDIVTTINGNDYYGKVYIYDVGGNISIVNEVELEDYLSSVLPNRLQRSISEEGVAAAAIAERTSAFYKSLHAENPYWHINARESGYNGVHKENINAEMAKALSSTRHIVLSKTGLYEGVVTPYPISLVTGCNDANEPHSQKITLDDIELLSRQGMNAAKMLSKSFPEATVALTIAPRKNEESVADVKVSDFNEATHR